MRVRHMAWIAAVGGLCACSPSQTQRSPPGNADKAEPAPIANSPLIETAHPKPPVIRSAPPTRPVIDPKSSEAAANLAQGFVDLLNRGRFDAAYMLVGPGAPPRGDFDRQFAALSGLVVTMGTPGGQEGAAGSSYISIPMEVAGRLNGKRVDRSMTLIMRRVNDVPGSTEAQRRWHIDRIDAQPS
jgi:hypothetical protein